jgi:hypothetical protein
VPFGVLSSVRLLLLSESPLTVVEALFSWLGSEMFEAVEGFDSPLGMMDERC